MCRGGVRKAKAQIELNFMRGMEKQEGFLGVHLQAEETKESVPSLMNKKAGEVLWKKGRVLFRAIHPLSFEIAHAGCLCDLCAPDHA